MVQKKLDDITIKTDKAHYIEQIEQFKLPRYAELPGIDLYMDQMLGYLEETVGYLAPQSDKRMTSSMVNNYVKQRLIPRPQARKYNRNHVAYLIVVSILKQCFSISEIISLIEMQIEAAPSSVAYDSFCTAFEHDIRRVFGTQNSASSIPAARAKSSSNTPLSLMLSTITATTNRLYVAKMIEFDSQ